MFRNLIDLLSKDCKVIVFDKDLSIYPISKNGSSSLQSYAKDKALITLKNEQIKDVDRINVYLRNPIERFVSGVYTYCYLEEISVSAEILHKIERGQIVNNHFAPQYFWLLSLKRFFNGDVVIRPNTELFDLIPNRDGPWNKKPKLWNPNNRDLDMIRSISNEQYTKQDNLLIKKYMFKQIKITELVTDPEIKNALS